MKQETEITGSSARILIVDDEPGIVKTLKAYLEAESYVVAAVGDGDRVLEAVRSFQPDVVILDVMLPSIDGVEVLRQLRQESSVYVLMLSARSEEVDRIVGLRMGADDYVVKPFSPREVMARIATLLRRARTSPGDNSEPVDNTLRFRDIAIDPDSRQVWKADSIVDLTPTEFDLLHLLAVNHGRVLSRDQLIDHVWGNDYFIDERVVDVHIRRLRRKIEDDPSESRIVMTVRGAGYRIGERYS